MYDYRKQLTWAKLKVGIVVTIAFLTLFFAVMFAGNIGQLFSPKVKIFAIFSDVKGLRQGAPVWFSGIEIGSVKSLDLAPGQKIKVTMSIAPDALKYLKKDSRANILTLGLLGDKYVEISPGSKGTEGLTPGDVIKGSTQVEFQDIVQTSQESLVRLTEFMHRLEELLVKIEKGEGTVSRFLTDPTVYDNLKETTEGLAKIVNKVESGKGSMGRLINDDTVYLNISSSVEDIRIFAEALKASEGTLNKLIKDPSLYERFLRASESLDDFSRKLLTSRGTVNRLIEDESLYENVNAVSERLDTLLERIDKGEGIMGSLVRDEELSKDLKTTVRELSLLIKDIKEHPRKYFKFSIF